MSDIEATQKLIKDALDLAKNWAFAVGLLISCNVLWQSPLPAANRAAAVIVIFLVGVAVIALAAFSFIGNRAIVRNDPGKRTKIQTLLLILLLSGLTLAAWAVIDTTVSYMESTRVQNPASARPRLSPWRQMGILLREA